MIRVPSSVICTLPHAGNEDAQMAQYYLFHQAADSSCSVIASKLFDSLKKIAFSLTRLSFSRLIF